MSAAEGGRESDREEVGRGNALDGICRGEYTTDVEIEYGRGFGTWLRNLKKEAEEDPESRLRFTLAVALLSVVRDLPESPTEETMTLKRVRQCRRHPVWRLAHPFHEGIAIRILCWFPDEKTVVVALVGGDKGPIGDIWYGSAAPRAEAAIDQWKREQGTP